MIGFESSWPSITKYVTHSTYSILYFVVFRHFSLQNILAVHRLKFYFILTFITNEDIRRKRFTSLQRVANCKQEPYGTSRVIRLFTKKGELPTIEELKGTLTYYLRESITFPFSICKKLGASVQNKFGNVSE